MNNEPIKPSASKIEDLVPSSDLTLNQQKLEKSTKSGIMGYDLIMAVTKKREICVYMMLVFKINS